jgi:hypothetical protein
MLRARSSRCVVLRGAPHAPATPRAFAIRGRGNQHPQGPAAHVPALRVFPQSPDRRPSAVGAEPPAPHRAGSCSVDAAEMVGTGGAASAASAGGKKGAAYSGTPPPEPRSPPTRVCSAACVGDHCFHVAWRDFAT